MDRGLKALKSLTKKGGQNGSLKGLKNLSTFGGGRSFIPVPGDSPPSFLKISNMFQMNSFADFQGFMTFSRWSQTWAFGLLLLGGTLVREKNDGLNLWILKRF